MLTQIYKHNYVSLHVTESHIVYHDSMMVVPVDVPLFQNSGIDSGVYLQLKCISASGVAFKFSGLAFAVFFPWISSFDKNYGARILGN